MQGRFVSIVHRRLRRAGHEDETSDPTAVRSGRETREGHQRQASARLGDRRPSTNYRSRRSICRRRIRFSTFNNSLRLRSFANRFRDRQMFVSTGAHMTLFVRRLMADAQDAETEFLDGAYSFFNGSTNENILSFKGKIFKKLRLKRISLSDYRIQVKI